jgi:ABC-type uncharacterized transport system auxiliary subunit
VADAFLAETKMFELWWAEVNEEVDVRLSACLIDEENECGVNNKMFELHNAIFEVGVRFLTLERPPA